MSQKLVKNIFYNKTLIDIRYINKFCINFYIIKSTKNLLKKSEIFAVNFAEEIFSFLSVSYGAQVYTERRFILVSSTYKFLFKIHLLDRKL